MKRNLSCLATAVLFTVSSGVLRADAITSVSCATPGASFATGISSCTAAYYGYANASATTSVTLPSSAAEAAQIEADASVSAVLGGARGISAFSTAQSSTNLSINFDTTGPLRNGYLELNFLQTSWVVPGFGSLNESLTIGAYSVNPNGQNLSVFIPIQLGGDFTLTYLDSLQANGDAITGFTAGSIGSDISLQAFEADKSTAVQLFDPPGSFLATPEPASLGLLAAAIFLGVSLRRNFRRRS